MADICVLLWGTIVQSFSLKYFEDRYVQLSAVCAKIFIVFNIFNMTRNPNEKKNRIGESHLPNNWTSLKETL